MADLLVSNVTVIRRMREGGTNGRNRLSVRAKFVNTTAGGGTNRLLASAFGLKVIESCSHIMVDAATKLLVPAAPSATGDQIYTADLTQLTDANRANIADLVVGASAAYVEVHGYD